MTGLTSGFFATFATLTLLLTSCDVSPASMDLSDRATRQDALNARAEAVPPPTARLPAQKNVQTAALQPDTVTDELPPRRAYKYQARRGHYGHTRVYVVHRPRIFRPAFRLSFGRRW